MRKTTTMEMTMEMIMETTTETTDWMQPIFRWASVRT